MKNIKNLTFVAWGIIIGVIAIYLFNDYKIKKIPTENINIFHRQNNKNSKQKRFAIDQLTKEELVINYVKKYKQLPQYYLTKSEAKQQGWITSKGNLCEVLPGKAIGGDYFSNREKKLPKGKIYYEADINYNCGNRNADRIIFTKDGEVWLTHNHYKTFEKQ